MAMENSDDMQRSYKELKKMAKEQKKAKKKAKKKEKLEKKIAKKEAKMRKKGVFLDDVTPSEVEVEELKPEEYEAGPWVRKSTEAVPYLEKKIDRMADRHQGSTLHQMFEERYGESLIIPESYKEYELTDAEKHRLEELRVGEETVEAPTKPVIEGEEQAEVAEEGEAVEDKGEAAEGELKPFYYPFQLWLYQKYGTEKHIVVKIIILIVSIGGFVLLLIPRIVIFIIMLLVKKMKQRKTKKAKKVAKEKAAPEA